MSVKLYHANISTCSQKVRLALAEKGVEFEGIVLNLRAGDQYVPEYRVLNPNAVVPTLVNGNDVITESTVINEYIDDAFEGPALKPENPAERARMRLWTKQVDEGLHAAIVILSFCIAFRLDFLSRTEEEMAGFYARMQNPAKEEFYRAAIAKGIDHEGLETAVRRYQKLLQDMEAGLEGRDWLACGSYSLADMAYVPYMLRLEHLGMAVLWSDKPGVADWFGRIKQRPAYQTAVTDWLVMPAVESMQSAGEAARPRIREILNT